MNRRPSASPSHTGLSVIGRNQVQLTEGQRLGLVGNSGQTGVPHLHFHVMDRPLLAEAVGLPYEFESFTVQGVADLESVDRAVTTGTAARVEPTGAGPHENQLPLEMTVLDFA